MGNSTYKVQDLADDAASFAEIAPVLPTGGYADGPCLSMVNETMRNMLLGGPEGQPMNWKFNRFIPPNFFINSWQQDYFIPGLVNMGWLESCYAVNFSVTTYPKPVRPVEVHKDLMVTNAQNSTLAKICWMQNDTMITGTWGQPQAQSTSGLTNPGPGAVYTNPLGLTAMPLNPITQVTDAFGNLWVVTTYGTCGNTNPFATNLNPVYPSLTAPATVATTVTDGSVVWTAINPKGQGFRLNPIPGQTGPIWQINTIAQARVPKFNSLTQFLEPIPDDYYDYFKQGFFAQCYRRSPDPKVRAKFDIEFKQWILALKKASSQGNREMDDFGFVPTSNVMDTGYSFNPVNPAQPYGPWNN